MTERVHGHAPRVRRELNKEKGLEPVDFKITINQDEVLDRAFDTLITTGISIAVTQVLG